MGPRERRAGSNGERFCREKREKDFSFESILLLFRLRRRAERNECSVFMGPNTKHVHTQLLAHAHTYTQKDWQQHINEIKKVKEENKHVKQNVRRTSQWQVVSQG